MTYQTLLINPKKSKNFMVSPMILFKVLLKFLSLSLNRCKILGSKSHGNVSDKEYFTFNININLQEFLQGRTLLYLIEININFCKFSDLMK